jgi:flagellar protein FliT
MNGDHILAAYEAIARIAGQMLNAARAGDWEQLVRFGADYRAQTERLRQLEDGAPRDIAHERRKAELIRGALEDDARVRRLVEPWLANLLTLIGNSRQQQQLLHAYRSMD